MQENFLVRNSGVAGIRANDRRQVEVVATGLSYKGGVPLAIDCTIVSPLDAFGRPHSGAATRAGKALEDAIKLKKRVYKELVESTDLRLVVAAFETGGRASDEVRELLWSAAADKAQTEPARLRSATCRALHSRWCALLSTAAQNALAATLVEDGTALLDSVGGKPPALAVLLGDLDDCDWDSAEEEPLAERVVAVAATA